MCCVGIWSTMTQGPRRCGARKERRAGPSRLKDLQSREVDREQCVGSTVIRCLWYLRLRGKRRPRWLLKLYSLGIWEIGQPNYSNDQSTSFYSAWDLRRVVHTFFAGVPVLGLLVLAAVCRRSESARDERQRGALQFALLRRGSYDRIAKARWQTRNSLPLSLVSERPHGPTSLFLSCASKSVCVAATQSGVTGCEQLGPLRGRTAPQCVRLTISS